MHSPLVEAIQSSSEVDSAEEDWSRSESLQGDMLRNEGRRALIVPLLSTTNSPGSNGTLTETDFNEEENDHIGSNWLYSLEQERFVVLAIFCLNNMIGSAAWITFAPIEDAVQAYFQKYSNGESESISNQQVNWLSMISMAVYGPGTALCAWVIPRYGFRVTVIASSIIMAIGCIFRWISLRDEVEFPSVSWKEDYSCLFPSIAMRYSVLLFGQGLVALGQTVFMNAPAKIAACWFQQTSKTIGAINLCSNLGMILGQGLSPLVVVESTGKYLDDLLTGQALVMILCAVFTTLGYQNEEPKLPPSASEAARRLERQRQREGEASSAEEPDFLSSATDRTTKDLLRLCTNPQYILLLIAIGINYAVNSAIITLMEPWITVSGFSGDKSAGICGSLLVAGGMVGTAIASVLLDATKNYNQAIRWSFTAVLITAFGLVATLQLKCPLWILATAFTLTGMTQMPLLTICFDVTAAHTYPVSEELSSAGLQLVGQYLGIFAVDGMTRLIEISSSNSGNDDSNSDGNLWFLSWVNVAYLAMLTLSTCVAWFYDSDDPRSTISNDVHIFRNPLEEMDDPNGDPESVHSTTTPSSTS